MEPPLRPSGARGAQEAWASSTGVDVVRTVPNAGSRTLQASAKEPSVLGPDVGRGAGRRSRAPQSGTSVLLGSHTVSAGAAPCHRALRMPIGRLDGRGTFNDRPWR
jgi:hypothetical protein